MPLDPKLSKLKHAAGVNAPLHKALSHPLRYRILLVLGEIEASPKELSELLEEDFHRVCEHVQILKKADMIELVDEDSRRGGIQHVYKASVRPLIEANEWALVPKLAREANSVAILRIAIDDATAAVNAGTFDSHPRRALLQKPMIVDEQGFADADDSALQHLDNLNRIASEAAGRLAGKPGIAIKTVTIIHPAASPQAG
jgi:hypothetical protein